MAYLREPLLPRTTQTGAINNDLTLRPLPLSHIAFTYLGDVTASFDPARYDQIIARDLTRIRLESSGIRIIDIRGDDLLMLGIHQWGHTAHSPMRGGNNATARIGYTALLPLGRKLYDPNECLPTQPVESLRLLYEMQAEPGNVTTRIIQIEAVYLPDANPTRYLRYIQKLPPQLTISPNNDITLPKGNTLLGILLQQASGATTAGTENDIRDITILADQTERWIRNSEWYPLWAETPWRQAIRWIDGEVAVENVAAAYTQDAEARESRSIAGDARNSTARYAYVDFDPTRDGQHAINTNQFKDLLLRINGTAANLVRIIPLELVTP